MTYTDSTGPRRSALRKLAPAVIKDFEKAEKFAKESGLKYAGDPNLIEVDYFWIDYTSKISTAGKDEKQLLVELKKRTWAVFEAGKNFVRWANSDERKGLYERTRPKIELPHIKFYTCWPPNYGDEKRNQETVKYVAEAIEKYGTRVYTSYGELELRDGKLVIKEERG